MNNLTLISTSFLMLMAFKASPQIVIRDARIPVRPTEFYIASVTDERNAQAAIAHLAVKDGANKITIQTADLQGGPAVAIGRYIENNLQKNQSLRPVVISIREFELIETVLKDARIEGNIKLHLSFALQKNYGSEYLTGYTGELRYTRNNDNATSIEGHIGNILKIGLVYFNNWIKDNADTNRKLAKGVRVTFVDYTEQPEGDTIYYSPSRPLTWPDFQSHIRPARRFEAQVMPGIGYNQQAKIIKGIIDVKIELKAYLPKSAAWANYSGRDSYTLNHEQRHFDIVKIISEQFKQKILAQKLTPDTFEAIINMQYLDSLRDMNTMQKAYDKETSHGTNHFAQATWNDRIDKELKPAP